MKILLGCIGIVMMTACRSPYDIGVLEWNPMAHVIAPTGSYFDDEERHPPLYHDMDPSVPLGLSVPAGQEALPPYFAFVGCDQKHFIIPLTHDPEQILQPGDILLWISGMHSTPKDYLDLYSSGMPHASLVVRDSAGRLVHIDAPDSASGYGFDNHPLGYRAFHVLRLYGSSHGSNEVTIADAREAIASWAKRIRAIEHTYDSDRVAEYGKCSDKGSLKRRIIAGRGKLDLNCSEFVGLCYWLAGQEIPGNLALLHAVDRIDALERDERTGNKASTSTIGGMFGRPLLIEVGATDEDLDRWERGDGVTGDMRILHGHITDLLNACPRERLDSQHVANSVLPLTRRGRQLSVADIWESLYFPDSPLGYVGTYVGRYGRMPDPTVIGRGLTEVPELTREQGLRHEYYMHSFPIQAMAMSARGDQVATASPDQTIRVLNIRNGTTQTVARRRQAVGIQFVRNGRGLAATFADGSRGVFDIVTGDLPVPNRRQHDYEVQVDGDTVQVFHRGSLVRELRHPVLVASALITPDGESLITAAGPIVYEFSLAEISNNPISTAPGDGLERLEK